MFSANFCNSTTWIAHLERTIGTVAKKIKVTGSLTDLWSSYIIETHAQLKILVLLVQGSETSQIYP